MGCFGDTKTINGWLTKVKSDSAKARWLSSSNKRYFTLNFETQTFYYAHDETNKKIANPIDFYDIMHAEQLPQVSEGRRSLKLLNTSQQMEYGFIVRTRDREIRLFAATWKEGRKWVDALNAAGSVGRSQKGLVNGGVNGGLKVENSHSQASLSTNEGSGSGSSPPSDDGSDGAGPWQPVATWDKPINGGYARAPWKPTPHGAPPIWAQVGQPHTGDVLPPWAAGPEPGSKANENLELASGEDAFAALDALASELGPVPEAYDLSPKKAGKASKGIVRNARDIAALKNPELQVSIPPAGPAALPSFGALPSVAPLPSAPEPEKASASTPTKNNDDAQAPQQFSSLLGSLPGPQQFTISDSPQKDDDEHSWDEPDAADKAAVADVIAYEAEARGEGVGEDNDPWDSETDEAGPKLRQRGPTEGSAVDHNSWDSEDEENKRVVRKRTKSGRKETAKEDVCMEDLDDLVGEVLDGEKRVAVHEKLSDFRCTQCDHAIIRFAGFQWAPEVDYLFVRNFHGKPEKLRPKLKLSTGDAAYCCQCSWKTAPSSEAFKEVGADLRWRVIG
jgi:hypothetical protein